MDLDLGLVQPLLTRGNETMHGRFLLSFSHCHSSKIPIDNKMVSVENQHAELRKSVLRGQIPVCSDVRQLMHIVQYMYVYTHVNILMDTIATMLNAESCSFLII